MSSIVPISKRPSIDERPQAINDEWLVVDPNDIDQEKTEQIVKKTTLGEEKPVYAYENEYSSSTSSSFTLFPRGLSTLKSRVESGINNQTVIRGASIKWDQARLISGSLQRLKQIGGVPVLLKTNSGDNISAMQFTVNSFLDKLGDLSGQPTRLDLKTNHPFFEKAIPVHIQSDDLRSPINGVVIPYDSSIKHSYRNPQEFLVFCDKMKYKVVWQDTLEDVTPTSRCSLSSPQKNILIIQSFDHQNLIKSKEIQIDNATEFDTPFAIFDLKSLSNNAIIFDKTASSDDLETLMDKLKIYKTRWDLINIGNQFCLIDRDFGNPSLLNQMQNKNAFSKSLFSFNTEAFPKPEDSKKGVVVLSMNQTNSFTQYPHEILSFLLDGMDVFVYDNAGKGLSTGSNSEKGLIEAIKTSGNFLIKEGYKEEQMMFKGQCAGGLPSSEAAKIFPKSHVWIDQAPRNFSGTVKDMYLAKLGLIAKNNRHNPYLKRKVISLVDLSSGITSRIIELGSKCIFPSFDVVNNLKKNEGIQIYTIGIPDKRGIGGDQLVPISHQQEIIKEITSKANGHYLPIIGGTHVTDWFSGEDVRIPIKDIIKKEDLVHEIFPATTSIPSLPNKSQHLLNPLLFIGILTAFVGIGAALIG